jgi:ATP-dependent Clp protease protease subunit
VSTYTIPNVIRTHPRGDRVMDVYSHLLSERIVYLGTEIDDGVSNALIAQILHLESDNAEQPIDLYINSPGGSLTATFAVYDAMEFVRAPIATTCIGQACSTAAILLAAGAPGKRSILPHARVLVLSHHTGQPLDTLRRDTDRDRIFTPEAAVEYGLVDRLVAYRTPAEV